MLAKNDSGNCTLRRSYGVYDELVSQPVGRRQTT